jgi:hypothetical protein
VLLWYYYMISTLISYSSIICMILVFDTMHCDWSQLLIAYSCNLLHTYLWCIMLVVKSFLPRSTRLHISTPFDLKYYSFFFKRVYLDTFECVGYSFSRQVFWIGGKNNFLYEHRPGTPTPSFWKLYILKSSNFYFRNAYTWSA